MNLTPSSSSGGMSLNPTVTLLQAKDVNVYYPYGTHFSDVFATTDRYQYSGKELDRLNGLDLYDFHARQYDPVLGRYLNSKSTRMGTYDKNLNRIGD